MYERFTDRARKVMALANEQARHFNHEYIGTEHILLGLVIEGTGIGANILKNLDVDLKKVWLEIEKLVKSGPDPATMAKLPMTPRAKKVIEFAIEEARNLNHNYVGTEHILLGLLREHEGVAAHVLMNLNLKLEEVREEVLNLLGTAIEPRLPIADAPITADKPLGHFMHDLLERQAAMVGGTEAAGFFIDRDHEGFSLRPIDHIRRDSSSKEARVAAIQAFIDLARPCVEGGKDGAIKVGPPNEDGQSQYSLITLLGPEGRPLAVSTVIVRCADAEAARRKLALMQLFTRYFDWRIAAEISPTPIPDVAAAPLSPKITLRARLAEAWVHLAVGAILLCMIPAFSEYALNLAGLSGPPSPMRDGTPYTQSPLLLSDAGIASYAVVLIFGGLIFLVSPRRPWLNLLAGLSAAAVAANLGAIAMEWNRDFLFVNGLVVAFAGYQFIQLIGASDR